MAKTYIAMPKLTIVMRIQYQFHIIFHIPETGCFEGIDRIVTLLGSVITLCF